MTFRNNQVMSSKILQSCAHIIPVRVMGKILYNVTSATRSGQQSEQDEFLVTFCRFCFCFHELKNKEMSKSQDEPPHELENQFILRLPLVRNPFISDQISSVHMY